MNKSKTLSVIFSIIFFLLIVVGRPGLAGTEIPKAELPILSTSAGQSTDIVTTVNIVLEEAGYEYDYCDVPSVDLVAAGVGLADKESGPGFHVEVYTDMDEYPKGTPYKTLIFAIGASLKGMGASGLTVGSEVARLKKIIDHCKQNKIFIVAVHVGGGSKRGAPGSDNERMIDAVAPHADFLVVTADGNKDGRFTAIAREKGIPLAEIEYALDLVEIFKQMFK